MAEIKAITDAELLALSVQIADELRERGLVRSGNGITGDYAEKLVADTLGLKLANQSASAYDALGADGTRYQIKARRRGIGRGSRQLGAIRNLDDNGFDQLIAVLFDRFYKVSHAYLIPPEVVRDHARWSRHVNAHLLVLSSLVLADPRIQDIRERFTVGGAK